MFIKKAITFVYKEILVYLFREIAGQPKLMLATTLEQSTYRTGLYKHVQGLIKEWRGWTKRRIHIAAQRAKLALRYGYYKADCIRRWGDKCLRCLVEFNRIRPMEHVDHVQSLYDGGYTDEDNHQPLCAPCNLWKGKKTIDYRPEYLRLKKEWNI